MNKRLSDMGVMGNIIVGLFIPLVGAVLKLPLAGLLILIGKALADPLPKGASFVVGVLGDTFGYVLAIWLANMMMLGLTGTSVAWLLLVMLCIIIPWLSWDRMYAANAVIRWHEIGCNVGRVCGLIVGGFVLL